MMAPIKHNTHGVEGFTNMASQWSAWVAVHNIILWVKIKSFFPFFSSQAHELIGGPLCSLRTQPCPHEMESFTCCDIKALAQHSGAFMQAGHALQETSQGAGSQTHQHMLMTPPAGGPDPPSEPPSAGRHHVNCCCVWAAESHWRHGS
jgi:hypothetical protein